jgi:hypothetical protein
VETTLAETSEGSAGAPLLLIRGAAAAGTESLLDDLIEVAKRHETTTSLSTDNAAVACLRGLVFGILTPSDRQRLRRDAYASALAGSKDEAVACTAVAIAVIAADLCRGFTLEDCLLRCRQTLLEEAPMAVLDALHPLDEEAALAESGGAIASLKLAITTCLRNRSTLGAVQALPGDAGVARVLAGAFSNLELRDVGTELSENLASAAEKIAASASKQP